MLISPLELLSCFQLEVNPWRKTKTSLFKENFALKVARPSLRSGLSHPCHPWPSWEKPQGPLLHHRVDSPLRLECPVCPARNAADIKMWGSENPQEPSLLCLKRNTQNNEALFSMAGWSEEHFMQLNVASLNFETAFQKKIAVHPKSVFSAVFIYQAALCYLPLPIHCLYLAQTFGEYKTRFAIKYS